MSKNLVKYNENTTLAYEAGKRSLQVGAVGAGLLLAAALPFITVTMLVVMFILVGIAGVLFG